MVRVEIELEDEVYERLRERAADSEIPVERLLSTIASENARDLDEVSPEFRELISRQTGRYERLFARLGE